MMLESYHSVYTMVLLKIWLAFNGVSSTVIPGLNNIPDVRQTVLYGYAEDVL